MGKLSTSRIQDESLSTLTRSQTAAVDKHSDRDPSRGLEFGQQCLKRVLKSGRLCRKANAGRELASEAVVGKG